MPNADGKICLMKYGIAYIFNAESVLLLECLQQSKRQYELKPIWICQNHELTFLRIMNHSHSQAYGKAVGEQNTKTES